MERFPWLPLTSWSVIDMATTAIIANVNPILLAPYMNKTILWLLRSIQLNCEDFTRSWSDARTFLNGYLVTLVFPWLFIYCHQHVGVSGSKWNVLTCHLDEFRQSRCNKTATRWLQDHLNWKNKGRWEGSFILSMYMYSPNLNHMKQAGNQ